MKRTFAILVTLFLIFSACGNYSIFAQDDEVKSNTEVLENDAGGGSSQASANSENSRQSGDSVSKKSSDEPQPAAAKDIQETYTKVTKSGFISKIFDFLSMIWQKIKKILSKLPGIKQYNESVYSGDNYKKAMNEMAHEYGSDKRARQQSEYMLKQGEKKFFKEKK